MWPALRCGLLEAQRWVPRSALTASVPRGKQQKVPVLEWVIASNGHRPSQNARREDRGPRARWAQGQVGVGRGRIVGGHLESSCHTHRSACGEGLWRGWAQRPEGPQRGGHRSCLQWFPEENMWQQVLGGS